MHSVTTATSSELLTEHQAAEFLSVSVNTLRKWRSIGVSHSPPHVKLGVRVRYLRSDLVEYITKNRKTWTGQATGKAR